MRPQQLLLRKIAQQNLDPKVPYVSGKNGILAPKFKSETETEIVCASQGSVAIDNSAGSVIETQTYVANAKLADAVVEDATTTVQETTKRRFPPPRRKKAAVSIPSDE